QKYIPPVTEGDSWAKEMPTWGWSNCSGAAAAVGTNGSHATAHQTGHSTAPLSVRRAKAPCGTARSCLSENPRGGASAPGDRDARECRQGEHVLEPQRFLFAVHHHRLRLMCAYLRGIRGRDIARSCQRRSGYSGSRTGSRSPG